MNKIIYDWQAWQEYTNLRWMFNKLELSLRRGYTAAPAGVPVPVTGEYVVRPIYNLSGMGAGATVQRLEQDKEARIPAGYFWCERFSGDHISTDWRLENGVWQPVFCAMGYRNEDNPLYKFSKWCKITKPDYIIMPDFDFGTVTCVNTEHIGDKLIEIHLRHSGDFPENATEIIPVWSDMNTDRMIELEMSGYRFKPDPEDADGNLPTKRIGFYYR